MEPEHTPETIPIKIPIWRYKAEIKGINENLPDVIFRLDPELRIVYTNMATETILHIPAETIYGKSIRDLDMQEEMVRNIEEACRKVFETKRPYISEGYVMVLNSPRYYETRYVPEFDKDGQITGILGISRDASNRKHAEEELKQRLSLERALATISSRFIQPENLDEAIQQTLEDLGSLTGASRAYFSRFHSEDFLARMTHEWCSVGIEPMLSSTQEPASFSSWYLRKLQNSEMVIIEDASLLPADAQQVKKILEQNRIKKQLIFPVFCAATLMGLIGLDNVEISPTWRQDDLNLLQVTVQIIGKALQQTQVEEALNTHRSLLQQVLDTHPSSISLRDREGRFILANKAMADDLGMKVEEIVGKHIHEIPILADRAERYLQEDLQVMDSRQELNVPEELDIRLLGKRRWWQIIKRPIIQPDGKAKQVLGVFIDITDRKLAELELINYRDLLENLVAERTAELTFLNKQLEHEIIERKQIEQSLHNSITEKDILLREIHHRVKNNLQIISSLLDLQTHNIQDTQAIQAFQDSQVRIRAIAQVHEQLYQSEDLARVDFTWYIKNTASSLFSTYSGRAKGISFEVNTEGVILPVDIAIPLGLIISELISNSLKHAFPQSKEGGEIQVKLWRKDNEHYMLLVRDNGVGLPPELNWQNPSTLGMKLVNILTRQLMGTITLDSSQGTAFTVTFPPAVKQANRKP